MEIGNITKAATFKSVLHLSYKNTQLLFLWTVLFNIFMRQTLTDDFSWLHENMKCVFTLKSGVNLAIFKTPKKTSFLWTFQIFKGII